MKNLRPPVYTASFSRLMLLVLCLLVLTSALGQNKDIPLENGLQKNSEKWLIKNGMVSAKRPAKLKLGPIQNDNRRGPDEAAESMKYVDQSDPSQSFLFSFDLGSAKDTLYVEATRGKGADLQNDLSVYMGTNIHAEDLWVFIFRAPDQEKNMHLQDMVLTNGEEDIQFSFVVGDPLGKEEDTAPKGITLHLEGLNLGSMQFDSGGTFAYKRYVWINSRASKDLQLITAGVFASLLEAGEYFNEATIVEQ